MQTGDAGASDGGGGGMSDDIKISMRPNEIDVQPSVASNRHLAEATTVKITHFPFNGGGSRGVPSDF